MSEDIQQSPPPPPYQQPMYAPAPVEPKNGLGLAALIVGIIGITMGLIPILFWFALIMGVIALALGLAAHGRVRRGTATNKKVSIAGWVTGLASIALGVIGMVVVFNAVEDFGNDLEDLSNDISEYSQCVDAIDANDPNFSAKLEACNDI